MTAPVIERPTAAVVEEVCAVDESRSGPVSVGVDAEIPVVEMVAPMPGFPEMTRFGLVRLDDEGLLCSLQSLEASTLRFLVVPPAAFFPDYAPEIDDETVADLAVESAEDVLLLVVVNPGDTVHEATANLLAPVVVNLRNRRAAQVVLSDDLPVRAPLVA